MGHQLSAKLLSLQISQKGSLAAIFLLGCILGGSFHPNVNALTSNPLDTDEGTLQVTFVPPNGDAPRETRGGAARDSSCLQTEDTNTSLTALVPQSNYGLTSQTHPVFLVYMPSVPTGSIFFNLRDEQGQSVYETFLPVDNTTGVVTIEMPKEAPPLEIGKNYEWGVAVPCSARLRPDSPFVSGWVQRIGEGEPSVSDLNVSLDYAYEYGQQGLWYDMIALLAELKDVSPDSNMIHSNWDNVLQSANLGNVDS